MPLLENLVEGVSRAAGATGAVSDIEKRKADRTKLSEEERHANLNTYNDALDKITTSIGQIDPAKRNFQNPDWVKLNDALHKTISARTALFHPQYGPSAMGKLAELLKLKKPGPVPQTAGQAKDMMAETLSAAATPTQDEFIGMSPEDIKKARRIKAGLDPRATTEKPDPEEWEIVTITTPDGKEQSVQHNKKSNAIVDLAGEAIPKEQLAGAKIVPKKSAAVSRFMDFRNKYAESVGKKPEALSFAEIKYLNEEYAYESAKSGVSHVVRLEKNDKNQLVPVEYDITHAPANRPVDPNAKRSNVPKTAGEAKKAAAQTAPTKTSANVKVGAPVMTVANAAASKADQDYVAAVKLDSIAKQVEQKPDDAINQKRLAVALERISAGRFTVQALDYIKQAGWGNTIQEWIQKPGTGALPADIVRQFVEGAHQNLQAAQEARDAAHGPAEDEAVEEYVRDPKTGKLVKK